MRLVLTGGHLSPLLSIIQSLPRNAKVMVIGRKYALEGDRAFSLEYRTLKEKKNIFLREITTGRLQRRLTRYTIFSLLKFPYGFFQSLFILREFEPTVVLGFGGYVSVPVILAAFFLRIPVVIHEQTLEAGLANRIGSLFAKKICLSFESSKKFFPQEKIVVTGNPVRKLQISSSKFQVPNEEIPLIYVTGGSLGSHAINTLIEGCLKRLLLKFRIIHQTGDAQEYKDYTRLSELRKSLDVKLQKRYVLAKFIDPNEVYWLIDKADLVISRAGINTVSELIFLKKPCLLIPLPFSQNSEQEKNALLIKKIGLGEVVKQDKLSSEKLYSLIIKMFKKIDFYKKNAQKEKGMINSRAASKIIGVLYSVEKK